MATYYTPSIEEFRVGFEYEEQYNKDVPFFPEVVEADQDDYPDYDLLSNLKWKCQEKEVRVKYLDKEDIESLGLTVEQKPIASFNKGDCWIKDKNNTVLFDWFSEDFKENIEFNSVYFTVKNKSELKKLMQQLNII